MDKDVILSPIANGNDPSSPDEERQQQLIRERREIGCVPNNGNAALSLTPGLKTRDILGPAKKIPLHGKPTNESKPSFLVKIAAQLRKPGSGLLLRLNDMKEEAKNNGGALAISVPDPWRPEQIQLDDLYVGITLNINKGESTHVHFDASPCPGRTGSLNVLVSGLALE